MNDLYKIRSFSDKFSTCFTWLASNWKIYLKYFCVFVLPFCLVQGYLLKAIMELTAKGNSSAISPNEMLQLTLCFIVSIVSSFISYSLFYALIKETFINNASLQSCTIKRMWKMMTTNMPRLFLSVIVLVILGTVYAVITTLLAFASALTIYLTLPLFIVLVVSISSFQSLYLLTDDPILDSLTHSFRLGTRCWWGFFSTAFVMLIIVVFIQLIGFIPSYTLSAIKIMINLSGSGVSTSIMDFLVFLSNALMAFVSTATSILMMLITCIQYGHAVMKIDKEKPVNI